MKNVPFNSGSVALFEPGNEKAALTAVVPSTRSVAADELLACVRESDELRHRRLVTDVFDLAEPLLLAALQSIGARSLLRFPLLAQDQLIGVFLLFADTADAFSAEHVQLVEEIATDTAALYRLRHSLSVQEREAELSRANGRLREREDHIRTLYNSAPIVIFSVDATGIIIEINDDGLKLLGYQRVDVVGQSLVKLAPPEPARRCNT